MYELLTNTAIDPIIAIGEDAAIEALLSELRMSGATMGHLPNLEMTERDARRALKRDRYFTFEMGDFVHSLELVA